MHNPCPHYFKTGRCCYCYSDSCPSHTDTQEQPRILPIIVHDQEQEQENQRHA